MKFTPKLAAAAAIALPIGRATTVGANALSPCSPEDLAGEWMILYEVKKQEYCVLTVNAAGVIAESACHDFKRKDIGQLITGELALSESCAITGTLQFSKVEDEEEKAKKKGEKDDYKKGKYGKFTVKAQLSEDRSTIVGVFDFKKDRLSHLVGQRTQ